MMKYKLTPPETMTLKDLLSVKDSLLWYFNRIGQTVDMDLSDWPTGWLEPISEVDWSKVRKDADVEFQEHDKWVSANFDRISENRPNCFLVYNHGKTSHTSTSGSMLLNPERVRIPADQDQEEWRLKWENGYEGQVLELCTEKDAEREDQYKIEQARENFDWSQVAEGDTYSCFGKIYEFKHQSRNYITAKCGMNKYHHECTPTNETLLAIYARQQEGRCVDCKNQVRFFVCSVNSGDGKPCVDYDQWQPKDQKKEHRGPWVARDNCGDLWQFAEKPIRVGLSWKLQEDMVELDKSWFPKLTKENSPQPLILGGLK